MSIRLIAGLGNPGRGYADTRHNVGFVVVDAFVASRGGAWKAPRDVEAKVARVTDPGHGGELHVLKPQAYMNDSGRVLASYCRYHRFNPEEVVVVFDEINLAIGRTKLSSSGSPGGHNGLASILEHWDGSFLRFRVGIGPRQPAEMDLKDYVLGKFTAEQSIIITSKIPEYLEGLHLLLTEGAEAAMNRINRRTNSHDGSDPEKV